LGGEKQSQFIRTACCVLRSAKGNLKKQACSERSRMEPICRPLAANPKQAEQRLDDYGRREAWMMDGSTLINRLSSFLASIQRPPAGGSEKLFETSVK
jgi:hypothetical protein